MLFFDGILPWTWLTVAPRSTEMMECSLFSFISFISLVKILMIGHKNVWRERNMLSTLSATKTEIISKKKLSLHHDMETHIGAQKRENYCKIKHYFLLILRFISRRKFVTRRRDGTIWSRLNSNYNFTWLMLKCASKMELLIGINSVKYVTQLQCFRAPERSIMSSICSMGLFIHLKNICRHCQNKLATRWIIFSLNILS